MNLSITTRQKELLEIIYEYIKNIGYPPTFGEMREKLNVSSNQSVVDLIKKLKNAGLIKKNETAARGLIILPLGYEILDVLPLIPILGITKAGMPAEMIEITGEWQTLSPDVEQLQSDIFLLRVSGNSMINANINDGDVVMVQGKKEFVSGEIVLADNGGEATIKRFMSDDKPPYVYLKPENPNYQNILFTDEMRLKGKVISVFNKDQWKSVK